MKYQRYEYLQPGVETVKTTPIYGGEGILLPKFDYPISITENLKRAAEHNNPLWVPNSTQEFQSIQPNDFIKATGKNKERGLTVAADFSRNSPVNWTFTDWFLTDWTFIAKVGGPMLTPGFKLLEDVTDWEKVVKFPDLKDWDFDTYAENFMKNEYDPSRALVTDIGLGCSERFVSIMGGYTEAMLAFATEPEACADFFEAFIDHEIEQFDRFMDYYPFAMITYHDDWGNEKDTFFSPDMLKSMLFKPTKRFIDHVKSKGVLFEFHSCGNIMRFLPYFIELGVDFLQIQRRAVDFVKLKKEYGDKIGFGTFPEGLDFGGPDPTKEELTEMIHKSIDMFAATGGLYCGIMLKDPELSWYATNELYAYGREFYDKEQGRS